MNITNFPENESELFSRKNREPTTKTLKMSLKKSQNSIILVPFFVFFSPSSILTPQVSVYFEYLKLNTRFQLHPFCWRVPKKVMTLKALRPITCASTHAVGKNGQYIGGTSALPGGQRMPYQFRFRRAPRHRWWVWGSLGSAARNLRENFPHRLSYERKPLEEMTGNGWPLLVKVAVKGKVPKVWVKPSYTKSTLESCLENLRPKFCLAMYPLVFFLKHFPEIWRTLVLLFRGGGWAWNDIFFIFPWLDWS